MTEENGVKYEGPKDLIVHDNSQFANLLDTAKFNHMWRIAQIFSKTDMVPDHFRGKAENCFVALQMAFRLEVDPMMFLQKSYIVYGRPGIEAQLKIGLVNQRGPFNGPIQWKFERDEKTKRIKSCTAFATLRSTGQKCEMEITDEVVRAEGWLDKKGSKWQTIPEKMYRYRSASWLIDTNCPEVTIGLPTVDELMDESDYIDVTPKSVEPPEPEPTGQQLLQELMESEGRPEMVVSKDLDAFIVKTASALRLTPYKVMKEALSAPVDFWNAFNVWCAPKDGDVVDVEPDKPEGPTEEELIASARKELRALCKEMKSDPPKDLNEWSLEKLNNGIKEVLRVKTKMQEMQQQEEPPMPETPAESNGSREPFIWTPDADQEKRIIDLLGRLKKDISYGGFVKAVNFYADAAGMGEAKLNGYVNTMLSATEIEQNGYIEAIMAAQ